MVTYGALILGVTLTSYLDRTIGIPPNLQRSSARGIVAPIDHAIITSINRVLYILFMRRVRNCILLLVGGHYRMRCVQYTIWITTLCVAFLSNHLIRCIAYPRQFPAMSANPTARANFAKNCIELIQAYDFDGIDIDWGE